MNKMKILSFLMLVLTGCMKTKETSPVIAKRDINLECSSLALSLAAQQINLGNKYIDKMKPIWDIVLSTKGIKPITEVFQPEILSKEYNEALVNDFGLSIVKHKKSGGSYKDLEKISRNFSKNSINILQESSPEFFETCKIELDKLSKNCKDYEGKDDSFQKCMKYEQGMSFKKLSKYFDKSSILNATSKAKELDKEIEEVIKKDDLLKLSELIKSRTANYGTINPIAIRPSLYYNIVKWNARVCFKLISKSSKEDRALIYSYFKEEGFLIKLAIERKGNEILKFFLKDEALSETARNREALMTFAQNKNNTEALEILKQ